LDGSAEKSGKTDSIDFHAEPIKETQEREEELLKELGAHEERWGKLESRIALKEEEDIEFEKERLNGVKGALQEEFDRALQNRRANKRDSEHTDEDLKDSEAEIRDVKARYKEWQQEVKDIYAGRPRRVPSSPSEYPLGGPVARGAALRSRLHPAPLPLKDCRCPFRKTCRAPPI
jgi:DNA repair exonuclease SbcCD ATPase subunit